MSKDSETPQPGGQFLVCQTEDGKLKIDVRFEGETVWLTQQHMAGLFQTTKQNIGQHLKSIFAEGELALDSVVKDSFTTAADGKNYATRFYNLDAIISANAPRVVDADFEQATKDLKKLPKPKKPKPPKK
jgi:hypothetical protein